MMLRTTQEQTEKNRRNKVQQQVLVSRKNRGMTNEARREKEKKKHEKEIEKRQDKMSGQVKRDEMRQNKTRGKVKRLSKARRDIKR